MPSFPPSSILLTVYMIVNYDILVILVIPFFLCLCESVKGLLSDVIIQEFEQFGSLPSIGYPGARDRMVCVS